MKAPPPTTAAATTPCYKQTPKCSPKSLYMVTEEMDCFTYPTNAQATVSFFHS